MKHVIVGTAGHIDHGKTALIKALTGTDTDRLKEEQQRGITIDIGFAFLALKNGIELGIIDVPGHERFVKNMLAGVGGIDLAILVIAADEGVMPQTEEHLAICNLLQIQQGLVALTKVDLVDEEWQALVTDDIRQELAGTFLQDAPIIPVSSRTGAGLETLLAELETLAVHVRERRPDGVFRLPVDRVFTIKGFGTVVTGTLISGSIQPEDTIEILPQQITTRVRHVQVHETSVPVASAGQRTALNLHGIDKQAIQRGNVLSTPDLLTPTYMLDAWFSLLPKVAKPLKNRSRVRFHHGTSEILARLVLFDREELIPGESAFVQIRLEAPVAALARDRYIIRSYSPIITIGGGEIVHVHPKKHKQSAPILSCLKTLWKGTLEEILDIYVDQAGFEPVVPRTILGMLAVPEQEIMASLQELIQQQQLVNVVSQGIAVLHASHYHSLQTLLLEALKAFHQTFPLKLGMPKEELRKKLPASLSPQVFQFLLQEQVQAGAIGVEQNSVRAASHSVRLTSAQQAVKQHLAQIYRSRRFQPPTRKEALNSSGVSEHEAGSIFELLLDEGTLVRIDRDLYYHQEVLDEIRRQVVDYLTHHAEMSVGDCKTLLQVSRKYAVPILAYLDADGLTIRNGDVRILRRKSA
jgi:selenocysteine-specific elongation factor